MHVCVYRPGALDSGRQFRTEELSSRASYKQHTSSAGTCLYCPITAQFFKGRIQRDSRAVNPVRWLLAFMNLLMSAYIYEEAVECFRIHFMRC